MLPTYYIESGSLAEPGAHCFRSSSGHLASAVPHLCPQPVKITGGLFMYVLGIRTLVFYLQVFHPESSPQAPVSKKVASRTFWHMPSTPIEADRFLYVQNHSRLYPEFQTSQGYRVRPTSKGGWRAN